VLSADARLSSRVSMCRNTSDTPAHRAFGSRASAPVSAMSDVRAWEAVARGRSRPIRPRWEACVGAGRPLGGETPTRACRRGQDRGGGGPPAWRVSVGLGWHTSQNNARAGEGQGARTLVKTTIEPIVLDAIVSNVSTGHCVAFLGAGVNASIDPPSLRGAGRTAGCRSVARCEPPRRALRRERRRHAGAARRSRQRDGRTLGEAP
jgi:hypothetical protein